MNIIDDLLNEITPEEQARVHNRMMMAARIADALAEKGWTQKQLAERMKKQPSEISKWLSGTHNFTQDTLSDLQLALGVKFLCVKEGELKELTQTVTRYQTIWVGAAKANQIGTTVPWSSFQESISQLQPNG